MAETNIPEGLEPAVVTPVSPQPDPATPKSQAAPETEAEEAEVETSEEDAKPEEPKRNRYQDRIDQLVRGKHDAEREAAMLRKQIERLQSVQPSQINPDDWEAQQREATRSVLREERMTDTQVQAEWADQQARAARENLFMARVEAARERIPEIDQSLAVLAQMPITAESAEIIAESDKAAEIAHYLGRNPAETIALAQMTPAQQGRRLAQIEARLTVPVRRTSQAPAPVPTVTATSGTANREPSDMSASEYIEWRQKQWRGAS